METNLHRIIPRSLLPKRWFGCLVGERQISSEGTSRQMRARATPRKLVGMLCLAAATLFSGCSITKIVKPVPAGAKVQTIHVIENDDVLYKQSLLDEMLAVIRSQGFEAISVRGEKPETANHHLTYRANWGWDLAMYLTFFKATLYEGEKILGEVEYDARSGSASLGKFGTTAAKIRPLLEEMLKNIKRPGTVPVVESEGENGK